MALEFRVQALLLEAGFPPGLARPSSHIDRHPPARYCGPL